MSEAQTASREERRVVHRVVRVCSCGGEMEHILFGMRSPFLHKHKCGECGAEEWLDKKYPFLENP